MLYVLSDIHGHKARFESIMSQIRMTDTDQLVVLGDVIDRNPYGLELLLRLWDMPNTTVLMGNHEYMMRDCIINGEDIELWMYNGGEDTLKSYLKLGYRGQAAIRKKLFRMPMQIDVNLNNKTFTLVHAAPKELNNSTTVDDDYFCVWQRLNAEDIMPKGKTVVFGHTPTYYFGKEMPLSIWYGNNMLDIDCGAAFDDGRLACIRLDDMWEFYSEE